MNATPHSIACAKCGAAVASTAQFCPQCGGATAARTPPPQPPPPPPPPPPSRPQALGGGSQAQVSVNADLASAFTMATAALHALPADLGGQQAPHSLQFTTTKKSLFWTLGTRLRYRGEVSLVSQGPQSTLVRISAKLEWGSAGAVIAICAISVVLVGLFLLPLAVVALNLWWISSRYSKEVAETLASRISEQRAYAPSPSPSPAPPPAPASFGGSNGDDVQARLRRLKELFDAGVISADEFAAKRADLISRL